MAHAWHGRFKTEVQEEKLLSIRLLGPPEVGLEWRPLRFRLKKPLALLCYLAAEGGRPSRRELDELLWPENDERRARTDLDSALAKPSKTLTRVVECCHVDSDRHQQLYRDEHDKQDEHDDVASDTDTGGDYKGGGLHPRGSPRWSG